MVSSEYGTKLNKTWEYLNQAVQQTLHPPPTLLLSQQHKHHHPSTLNDEQLPLMYGFGHSIGFECKVNQSGLNTD